VISRKALSMVRVNGRNSRMLRIAISMKGITFLIRRMGMECLPGRAETFTKVTTEMMKEMAMEKCIGLMDQSMKDSGRKESSMGKVK
jgi:hypothetical protein